MNIQTKDQLQAKLFSNIAYITFEKRDKSIRKMICTRQPNLYPTYIPKTKEQLEYDHLLVVWDLEACAFRSMVIDNIMEMRFEKKQKGIYFNKKTNRYIVRKQINGKRKYLGSATTYSQAMKLLVN